MEELRKEQKKQQQNKGKEKNKRKIGVCSWKREEEKVIALRELVKNEKSLVLFVNWLMPSLASWIRTTTFSL